MGNVAPLVLSSSALKTYKDCPKAFDLGYVKLLEPSSSSEAVDNGTEFHRLIAEAARGNYEAFADTTNPMVQVASDYLDWRGLPMNILRIEEPIYVKLMPGVVIRCTWDLVYQMGREIIIRDYKTFVKAPTVDLDLDFQGRFYIAAAMKHFKTPFINFEYEYVRQELYHQKGGLPDHSNPWSPEDRYLTYPLIISDREAGDVWREAQWIAKDIKRKLKDNEWYRADKKGFGGCGSCFYKHLCKAENQLGTLDQDTINLLSTPREAITLPDVPTIARK